MDIYTIARNSHLAPEGFPESIFTDRIYIKKYSVNFNTSFTEANILTETTDEMADAIIKHRRGNSNPDLLKVKSFFLKAFTIYTEVSKRSIISWGSIFVYTALIDREDTRKKSNIAILHNMSFFAIQINPIEPAMTRYHSKGGCNIARIIPP